MSERQSWGKTGFNAADEESDKYPRTSSQKKKDFWMTAGQTKRILVLDNDPFCFWAHNFYPITKVGGDTRVCLDRNKIDDRGCPPCLVKKDYWPFHVGCFSIIDMGDVEYGHGGRVTLSGYTKDGTTYQFGKKILAARTGSKKKPGMLKEIQRLASKYCGGKLAGTVWDAYRSGEKTESIGDRWEFIEQIPMDKIQDYLIDLGANPEYLSLEPYNYYEVFEPDSYENLARLVGMPTGEPSQPKSAYNGGDRADGGTPF